MEEYRTLREEILLRMKGRNSTGYYVLLLMSAVILGIWQVQGKMPEEKLFAVFLLIVPITSLFLAVIYSFHDVMIARLGGYINQVLRPKLMDVCDRSDILAWEPYLSQGTAAGSFRAMALCRRLIFVVTLAVSTICPEGKGDE